MKKMKPMRRCDGRATWISLLTLSRTFLTRAYPTMKKNNPNTPILLREAQGTLPKIYARYGLGRETSKTLEGRSSGV